MFYQWIHWNCSVMYDKNWPTEHNDNFIDWNYSKQIMRLTGGY